MADQQQLAQQIIDELGIGSLPEDKRDEMIAEIGAIIYQAVLMRVVPLLSPEEQSQFDALADEDNPQKLLDWLQSTVEDFNVIVADELAKFKNDAGSMLEELRGQGEK